MRGTARTAARQAGTDTWKTFGRRAEGPDGFQLSDLLTGVHGRIKHALRRRRGDERAPGKRCPICDEEEPPEVDAEGKRWLRLYCGCTACSACVRRWSMSLLDAAAASGAASDAAALPKLRCPACAAPLTTADAEEVLRRSPAVAGRYDRLSRDATLRAMPEWRGCPCCGGGGFTSAACLQPLREELSARLWARVRACESALSLLALVALHVCWAGEAAPLAVAALASALGAAARVVACGTARAVASTASAPLSVACPECEASFLVAGWSREGLAAHAGGGSSRLEQAEAEKTARWVQTHTRPCPSCGSPIQKTGGCNHMRCGGCNNEFCWACMRTRTQCGHFGCHNGAPFGDAPPGEDGPRGAVDDAVDAELSARDAERRAGVLVRCAGWAGGLAAAVVAGALSAWADSAIAPVSASGRAPLFSVCRWLQDGGWVGVGPVGIALPGLCFWLLAWCGSQLWAALSSALWALAVVLFCRLFMAAKANADARALR